MALDGCDVWVYFCFCVGDVGCFGQDYSFESIEIQNKFKAFFSVTYLKCENRTQDFRVVFFLGL